jgi:hypothetical protein
MPRLPKFSEEKQTEIVKILSEEFQQDVLDQDVWQDRRAQALDDLFSPSRGIKTYPWSGASNITPPLVAKAVRTVWPRLVGALLNIEPIVQAMAVDPRDQDSAEARAAYINYQVKNVIPRFKREISTWLLDLTNGGSSVLLTWFEQQDNWLADWMALDNSVPQFDPLTGELEQIFRKTDREVLEEIFSAEDILSAVKRGEEYKVKFLDDDGLEKQSEVFIDRDDKEVRDDQLSVLVKKMMRMRRVRVQSDRSENYVLPASASGYQRENSHHLARKIWMHAEDIEEFSGPREFNNLHKDEVQDLKRMVGFGGAGFEQDTEEEVIDRFLGSEKVWGLTGTRKSQVRVLEHYRPWKIDGRRFDMIFWTIPSLNKLAGWDYHTARFRHGRRPVTDVAFIPITKRPHGAGIWHLTHPYQEEAAVLFNQMNDRGALRNNPILLAEQNSGINPTAVRERAPGDVLTVRSVDRISPLTWGVEPLNDLPLLQQVFAYSEQAAGVGDIQIGVQPNRPNAPRTARGTLALIGEGNIILDTHVMLIQEAFAELIHQIDGLNEQYIGPEERFSITGKEEQVIRQSDFRSRVRFFFSGNTTNTNPQVQQAVSQFLIQNLVEHPIFTGAFVEMPEIAIRTQWKLLNHFIKQHVPGKDSTFILPELEELMQIAQQIAQQKQQQLQALQEAQLGSEGRDQDRQDLDSQTKALKVAGDISQGRSQNILQLIQGGRESE